MDSALRPRDIQARIRAGESPEAVADAAGTTLDRIMGFAGPVMAERGYVAQQAQRASVRRRAGSGPVGQLGDAVAEQLRSRDIDPETVEWDSWRRDDGRWTVVARFHAGAAATRATFAYDVAGRYVVAEDEESRRLVGERAGRTSDGSGSAEQAGGGPVTPMGEQTSLGDDAIEMVTGRRPEPVEEPLVPDPDAVTVDLTDTAAGVRSAGPATADADWLVTQASERPRGSRTVPQTQASAEEAPVAQEALFEAPGSPSDGPAAARTEPATTVTRESDPAADLDREDPDLAARGTDPEPAATERPDPDRVAVTGAVPDAGTPEDEQSPDEPATASQPRRPRKQARGKGRASVPSWDEIMFGSDRRE